MDLPDRAGKYAALNLPDKGCVRLRLNALA
jgi:hypothetical protein